jgi:predicted SprT family Zn-dependent metalloprotease
MWFEKKCPVCHKKYKRQDMIEVNRLRGDTIFCCKQCAKYFKVVKKVGW